MSTPTHLLIHRYTPGSGPAPGSPEHDSEMRRWEQLDDELQASGVVVAGFALDAPTTRLGAAPTPVDEIVFAVHVLAAASDSDAEQVAGLMPHLGYGSVEVRPLMAR